MCLTSVLIGVGLIAVLSPSAFLRQDRVHFEITVSRQLLVGLAVLLVFVNVYMVTKRLDIRRAREHLISTTIQSELVRPQSFTDPSPSLQKPLPRRDGWAIYQPCHAYAPTARVPVD